LTNKPRAAVTKVRAKTGWDEKILRAPSDIAVIFVGLTSALSLGVVGIIVLVALAALFAVVFVS
jgi:hypothetical protein